MEMVVEVEVPRIPRGSSRQMANESVLVSWLVGWLVIGWRFKLLKVWRRYGVGTM